MVSIIQYNRLKRENEELKKLIGELSLKLSLGEKIDLVKRGQLKSVRARALGINRKNIYRTPLLEAKDAILRDEIIKVHKWHPSYGHRRLGLHLKINPKRIRRVMKKYGLRPPRGRGRPQVCPRSIGHRKYPNLLKGLAITHENQAWCSDTSGFRFQGTMWYLVTIMDIFTRQVIDAAMDRHHNSALVSKTLQTAVMKAHAAPSKFPSNQGTEFGSNRFPVEIPRCSGLTLRSTL